MLKKLDNGAWELNIQPGGRAGRRIKRQFPTKTDALQFQQAHIGKLALDPDWKPKKDNRNLLQVIEAWHSAHGKALSAGKDTKRRLEALANKLNNPRATSVTPKMLADYRSTRIDEGVTEAGVNREIAYLKAMFNTLIQLGDWKHENPCARVKPFKVHETELTFLSDEQIDNLLVAVKSDKRRNIHVDLCTRICLATGARWSEAENLTIRQVKDDHLMLVKTKGKRSRAVPIDPDLANEIRDHHAAWSKTDRIFGPAWGAFREATEDAKIDLPDGQMSHVLRHTFASHFMANGGNILALQKILGHSDLKLTMRYAHLAPDALDEARRLNPLAKFNFAKFNKSSTESNENH